MTLAPPSSAPRAAVAAALEARELVKEFGPLSAVDGISFAAARRFIGMLSHRTFLYGQLTAAENLRFYGRLFGLRDLETRVSTLTPPPCSMGCWRRCGTVSAPSCW